jgi:hypothetical protein
MRAHGRTVVAVGEPVLATLTAMVDDSFHLVITSTVFPSILSVAVREMIASEKSTKARWRLLFDSK